MSNRSGGRAASSTSSATKGRSASWQQKAHLGPVARRHVFPRTNSSIDLLCGGLNPAFNLTMCAGGPEDQLRMLKNWLSGVLPSAGKFVVYGHLGMTSWLKSL